MRTRLKIAQRVQYSANIVLAVSTSCRAVHFSGQQDAVILIRSHWTRDVVTGWWVLAQTQAAIFVRYLNLKVFSLKTIDMSIFCFFFFFQICFSDLRRMLMMRLSRWQKCHGWQAYQPKIVTVLSAVSKRQSNQIWQPRTIMAIFENQTTKLS